VSKTEPVGLTREEMIDLRLNPDCPFCSERLPDCPADVRYGDDRVVRLSNGGMMVHFGYYTPYQRAARKAAGELFARAFAEKMGECGGSMFSRFSRFLRNE